MSELEVFGARCLDLLRDAATVIVLGHLRERPVSALDIQDAGTGLASKVALSRLSSLLAVGAVELAEPRESGSRSLRDAPHQLLTKGRALQSVVDLAGDCEDGWPTAPKPAWLRGTAALFVTADPPSIAIARALAYEGLRLSDLQLRLPDVTHGTLERRLRERAAQGLIHSEKAGREAWHSLTELARRLVTVPLHAAQSEWCFGDRDKSLLASDLAGLVYQIGPLVGLPERLSGLCVLHEDWHTTMQSDVYIVIGAGRLTALPVPPRELPDATCHGTPQQWIHALISGDCKDISCIGDRELLEAVTSGVHDQLCGQRR
jgi:DNA-binding HxlR family transcriptional regulator